MVLVQPDPIDPKSGVVSADFGWQDRVAPRGAAGPTAPIRCKGALLY